jgi:hypothetical protein
MTTRQVNERQVIRLQYAFMSSPFAARVPHDVAYRWVVGELPPAALPDASGLTVRVWS